MEFPVTLENASGQINFVIDASNTFGSGLHESTASCLRQLTSLSEKTKQASLLDVGCGSGILSIAAIKLGFSHVYAFDVKPEACETARRNFIRNDIQHQTTLFTGTVRALKNLDVDLIVANIQGDIVLDIQTQLPPLLKDNGLLITAGIAWDWLYDVKTAFISQGLTLFTAEQLEEFSTLVFQKP